MRKLSTVLSVALLALSSAGAYADSSCDTVKMADPGWSDIAATNAITGFLLNGMGYKAKVDTLAVPITWLASSGMRITLLLSAEASLPSASMYFCATK